MKSDEDPARPAHPARLSVVAARAGTAPHLLDMSDGGRDRSLCGVPTAPGRPVGWFSLAGCKRCVKAALRQGCTVVDDIDGDSVQLDAVLEG